MSLEFALGRQLTVDFYRCTPRILADCEWLKEVFLAAAEASNATVLDSYFHNFEPQGSSGVVIIAESHFAVHAWPEFAYAAVDIFTCSDRVDFECAVRELQRGMEAQEAVVSQVLNRGRVSAGTVEQERAADFRAQLAETTPSWQRHYQAAGAQAMSVAVDLFDCRNPEGLDEWLLLTGLKPGQVSMHRREGRVWLDIFSPEFLEPRPPAEAALAAFGAAHYTMRVLLRQ